MASSGSITNQFRTGYKLRINWSVTSQSTANNTSTMTVTAQLISDSSSYNINAGTVSKSISITVNGTSYSGTTTATISGGATKDLFTKTGIVVQHSADGTKSVSLSCSFGIAVTLSGTYWGTISASGSGVLNTIARASSCSFPTMNMGTAYNITITRADASFKHTIDYYFGTASGQIALKTTSTTVSWTPSVGLGTQIPSAASGTGKIIITTYNANGDFIGDKQHALTLNIPDTYKPEISSISTAVGTAAINTKFGGYVKGKTGVTTTINVSTTKANGSTVSSYKTTVLGSSYNGQTTTSSALTTSGTVNISCTITDSRGRTHTLTKDITVWDYANPSVGSFTAVRNATTQSTINCSYGFGISAANNKNDKTLQYRSRIAGGTWSGYTSITASAYTGTGTFNITGTSTDSSYQIEFRVGDYFTSSTSSVTVSTAFVTMDFKSGGKGIAIGKVAETEGLLDVAIDGRFRNSLKRGDLEVLTQGTTSGVAVQMTNVVTRNFGSNMTGIIFIRVGNTKPANNCMITIKGSIVSYRNSTSFSASTYYYGEQANFHEPIIHADNVFTLGNVYFCLNSEGIVHLAFQGSINNWYYPTVAVESVISGYGQSTSAEMGKENWGIFNGSDFTGYTRLSACSKLYGKQVSLWGGNVTIGATITLNDNIYNYTSAQCVIGTSTDEYGIVLTSGIMSSINEAHFGAIYANTKAGDNLYAARAGIRDSGKTLLISGVGTRDTPGLSIKRIYGVR